MVRGLDVFKNHFAESSGQYVLIGGTAASISMESAGLEFRLTKDLDIVLCLEALTEYFGEALWAFITAGGYEIRQRNSGKPVFYRFQKPSEETFPFMIELFSRTPDGLKLAEGSQLTPIPIEEEVSSLSAILMNEDYYRLVMARRIVANGLSWIGAECLIPLKAHAWLNLTESKKAGQDIDSKKINKHRNDVMRLSQLLIAGQQLELAPPIHDHLVAFLRELKQEDVNPKSLDLNIPLGEIVERIESSFRSSQAQ